jgi:hypothetical protein
MNPNPEVFERANESRCSKWKAEYTSFTDCDTECLYSNQEQKISVKGVLKGELAKKQPLGGLFLKFWASAPPTRGYSFTGSGIAYANPEMAFKGTPNKGILPIYSGRWSMEVYHPNAFYSGLGTTYNPPAIYFSFVNGNGERVGETHKIILGNGIPYRYMTWYKRDWNKGALFYQNTQMPLNRTQEQILRDSAYPSDRNQPIPANFWGTKPPC